MSTRLLPNELWIAIFEQVLHTNLLPSSLSTFLDELDLLCDGGDGGARSLATLKQQLAHKTIICLVCRHFHALARHIGANLVFIDSYKYNTRIRKFPAQELSSPRRLEFNHPVSSPPQILDNWTTLEVLFFSGRWGSNVNLSGLFSLFPNLRALSFVFRPIPNSASSSLQQTYSALQHPVFRNLTHLSLRFLSQRHLEKTHMPLLKFLSLTFTQMPESQDQEGLEDAPLPNGLSEQSLIPWTCPRLVSLEMCGNMDEATFFIFFPFLQRHAHQILHLRETLQLQLTGNDGAPQTIHLLGYFPNLTMYAVRDIFAYAAQLTDGGRSVILTRIRVFASKSQFDAGHDLGASDLDTASTKHLTFLVEPGWFIIAGCSGLGAGESLCAGMRMYLRDLPSSYTLRTVMFMTSAQELSQAIDDAIPLSNFRPPYRYVGVPRKRDGAKRRRMLLNLVDEFARAGIDVVDRFGVLVDEISIAPCTNKHNGLMRVFICLYFVFWVSC